MSDRRSALLALPLALTACAGARLDGNVYRDGPVRFRVGDVPAAWRRIDAEGARLAFRDDASGATVLVNARCGADAVDAPLAALTAHLFLMFTERTLGEQVLVPMDGREALHTVATAKLDGVPRGFDAYVLKKDGCVYDLVRIGPAAEPAAARAPFRAFVAGFGALGDP